MKTAFVQSAFYAGYFIVAIPASLFIKKTSYKIGIMTGLAFFALGCFIFFVDRISASYPLSKVRETRVLTVYMIIGCVILLGTAFILPRHRAVGRRLYFLTEFKRDTYTPPQLKAMDEKNEADSAPFVRHSCDFTNRLTATGEILRTGNLTGFFIWCTHGHALHILSRVFN